MLETLLTLDGWISLLTLAILEVVLGIDNIIFISIVAGKLPREKQFKARAIGLFLALIMRVGLLFTISWIVSLKEPLLALFSWQISGRDIILLAGGLFLIAKSTTEIHSKVNHIEDVHQPSLKKRTLKNAIIQIVILDIVFSFDSILTAVGLANNLIIMVLAVVIALIVMLIFSEKVSDFINDNPTIKVLALSFLLMIGFVLILDAFHVEVPKGYIYVAMLFSLLVETLNMRMRKKELNKQQKSKED